MIKFNLWSQINVEKTLFKYYDENVEAHFFNPDERSLLITKAWDEFNKNPSYVVPLMILLCNETGLKDSELVALKPSNIQGNKIRVRSIEIVYKDIHGKNVREIAPNTTSVFAQRELPINDEMFKIIKSLPLNNEYLFMVNGERVTVCMLDKYIRKLCKDIGIADRSMQKLRNTFLFELLDTGASYEVMREISGLNDINPLYNKYRASKQIN